MIQEWPGSDEPQAPIRGLQHGQERPEMETPAVQVDGQARMKPGLHLIADDLAEPGWIFWDWILFTRWLKAWTVAA